MWSKVTQSGIYIQKLQRVHDRARNYRAVPVPELVPIIIMHHFARQFEISKKLVELFTTFLQFCVEQDGFGR